MLLRVIHLTEWIWLKLVNMTEKLTITNVNMVNMTENVITITTTTNVNGWIWPKIENIIYFRSYSTVNVRYYIFLNSFFYLNIFGQIHPYFGQVRRLTFVGVNFWSCSNVKICRRQILTDFWSSWFGQVN